MLALNAHEKIGSQTIKKIVAAFDDLQELWQISERELRTRVGENISQLIIQCMKKYDPETELEKLHKLNIGYLTLFDNDYPPILKELPDAPAILYIRGEIKVLSSLGLAVVGSRKFTNYGQRITRLLVRECSNSGLSIVSGLALGIDGIAHRTALEAGGITIGVLGCGLDRIYPAAHHRLAGEVVARGGAIISEYPPGTTAYKNHFPARNRIIAGLSLGTLVVEAGEDSGALITAMCALDYNREVFAVPGNIDSENSLGANKLIQQGAKLVLAAEDILGDLPVKVKSSQIRAKEILAESEEEKIVLALLAAGEKPVDLIAAESKLNIIAINSALTMMEMKGMIENVGGGRYRKVG